MKSNDINKTKTSNPQIRSPQEMAKQAGENIRIRREEMKLNQEKLAKSAHVDVEKVRQYESGEFMEDLINICRITKELKCYPEQLVTYDSRRTKNAAELNSEIEEDERKEKKKETEEAKKLGQNIKNKRLALDIDQAQLAEEVGVRATTISRYEGGWRTPKSDILRRIAGCLGTTTDELLNCELPASGKKRATRSQNVVKTQPGERRKDEEKS